MTITNESLEPRLSIDQLESAIRLASGEVNAAQYRLLMLVREFDDRLGWARWSFPNCAAWLAWRCGLTVSAAREKVRTAQALRGLPRIAEAFADGRLSYSKVRALTRAADAGNEDLLLAYALTATATQVEERCRQLRNVTPSSGAITQRAWERRTLSAWRHAERGTMTLSVEVPIEAGELIVGALDQAIERGETAAGPEFAEASWQTQQADALVAVARAYLTGGSESGRASSADTYQVVVHVDEAALRGGVGRADLPRETVRRLSCDGSLVPVVENAAGHILNVGRRQRTVPPAIRRALQARDGGCAFPGCTHTHFVDAHHVRHWSDGGETSLDNLVLLCSHHHRLVHEGGFQIRRDTPRDGAPRLYFQRADGRVIPPCGYRSADAEPDPEELQDLQGTTARDWLAAVVNGRDPSAEGSQVREAAAVYRIAAPAVIARALRPVCLESATPARRP